MLTDKMKKTILMIMLMILPIAIALESTKVYIVDLSYNDGKLIVNDEVIIKYGYAPDRVLQPLDGYKAEIISLDNDILYTFKFEIPLNEYVDISDNVTNQITGGLIKLTETDFALVMPYYDDAKEIVFYDETNNKAASVHIMEEIGEKEEAHEGEEHEEKGRNIWLWVFEFLVLLVLIILFVRHKMKEKKEEE